VAETLVLGANGFVGSHLVDALANAGHSVRAFDRYSSKDPVYNEHEKVEMFVGDYLNKGDLNAALKDIDYLFHFISTTTPITAENDPTIDIETNIKTSVELFKLCVENDIKRVIFASTGGAIYGNSETGGRPHNEFDRAAPVSPYAIGKLAIENYLEYFDRKHGLSSVSLRISNPYGERQPLHRKQGVIPIFLDNIAESKPLTVYGDGSMVRDYIYVKDMAKMIVGMFDNKNAQNLYNIGSGRGNSINELLEMVEKVTGVDPVLEYKEVPPTFVQEVVLDVSRFESDFGKTTLTDLEVGMRSTYEYIKAQKNNQE
jgi:UDP-glucose 4-epimerase